MTMGRSGSRIARLAINYEGPYVATKTEGQVVALTAALADKNERLAEATSAGINTAPLKRQIAQIEADLATAKRRAAEEFHAVPGRTYA